MTVHEWQESWERFPDEILMPKLQAGVPGGVQTRPQETAIDVYELMP